MAYDESFFSFGKKKIKDDIKCLLSPLLRSKRGGGIHLTSPNQCHLRYCSRSCAVRLSSCEGESTWRVPSASLYVAPDGLARVTADGGPASRLPPPLLLPRLKGYLAPLSGLSFRRMRSLSASSFCDITMPQKEEKAVHAAFLQSTGLIHKIQTLEQIKLRNQASELLAYVDEKSRREPENVRETQRTLDAERDLQDILAYIKDYANQQKSVQSQPGDQRKAAIPETSGKPEKDNKNTCIGA